MKTIATGIALLALTAMPALPPTPSAEAGFAGPTSCTGTVGENRCGRSRYTYWDDRVAPADARLAITTENGEVTLVLTDLDVAIQLSNRTLHRVHRELKDAQDEQDHWLGSAIVTAVTGTVRAVLDHSLSCPVKDCDVSYVDGRLVFIARDGRAVFDDIEVCDTDVTSAFSKRDAERFVREFRRLKARN